MRIPPWELSDCLSTVQPLLIVVSPLSPWMASGGHPPSSSLGGGGRLAGDAFRMSLSPVQEGVEGSSVSTSIARRGQCSCVCACVCVCV